MPRPETRQFQSISSPGLVLCEGSDDFHFLLAMLRDIGFDKTVWIEVLEGRSQLYDRLNGLLLRDSARRLKALGIVCDADAPDDGLASFNRVRDTLRRAGFTPPASPGETRGTQWTDGRALTIGAYVMPDNTATGALEDLLLEALNSDASKPCVDTFITCVEATGSVMWRPQDRAKASMNAWLASRPEPSMRLDRAFTPQLIDPQHNAFDGIKAFLRQLAQAAAAADA